MFSLRLVYIAHFQTFHLETRSVSSIAPSAPFRDDMFIWDKASTTNACELTRFMASAKTFDLSEAPKGQSKLSVEPYSQVYIVDIHTMRTFCHLVSDVKPDHHKLVMSDY